MKRVRITVSLPELARLLGIPKDLRAVGLYATTDPDEVHILVEGDELPGTPTLTAAGSATLEELAATGLVEAPPVWHPIHGCDGQAPLLTWGRTDKAWRPGLTAQDWSENLPMIVDDGP
jgi:hypothetical protein